MTATPQPYKVHYSKSSNCLQLYYAAASDATTPDQPSYELPAEFLRVFSPSAEVQGHGTPVLQTGKKDVRIWHIEPVGRYALKLSFDDGHDSGLFTWEYLWHLATQQEHKWQAYLQELAAAGASRVPKLIPLAVDLGQTGTQKSGN